ncbi:Proton-dependent oligopeptide transporter family [Parasponia andersonii]|uniref:Proton-dependent oligopeptide transporter family n=1 Tax=Parasponia andersonii TaxID=3476 RepID=A0A2P5AEV9_PARAD|nr:Proton-dependent oligopeptide transporter family [Parasponia andersonii]
MASEQETQERNDKAVTTTESEVQYSGTKSMPFIIGNETCEKLGSIGTSNNLLVYLTTVFNMKAITATTLINIFNGTSNFAALPGAILSDTYFGRYQTLGFASVASFTGMLVLTLTAAITRLHPPHCVKEKNDTCPGPTPWQMAILLSGLGLMVTGAGGIRPCNLAFGADQFNPNTESGKKGINRFFNWYYFGLTFAMMVSFTLIAYVQSNLSWALGLAIPTLLMLLSCVLFFVGSRIYVKVKPNFSPLTGAVRVVVAAVKKRHLKLPEQPWLTLFNHIPTTSINSKLPYSNQFRFLDKAAIIDPKDTVHPDGSAANPWRLCSMQQVEEVKCLMRVIPIWSSAIIYYVAMVQQQTSVVFQALQSDRHLGKTKFKIPAATYSIFTMLGITICIPIYDKIIVPTLRRFTRKESGITLLQRMGSGMVLAVAAMLISALVEEKRRSFALTKPIGTEEGRGAISSVSAFWLVPQLTLIGFSEAFTVIGHIEFYYKEFPENMRTISGSFLYIGFAVSNYLNSFLVSLVHHITKTGSGKGDWLPEDLNEGRLDWFYYLVAALEILNLAYFLMCAKWYNYKGNTSNDIEVDTNNMQSVRPLH